MSLDINPINMSGFVLEAKNETIFMSGDISLIKSEEILITTFNEINKKIIYHGIKSIVLDLTKLKFLNSNGIKSLADWILTINALPENKKYFVKIKYDSSNKWHDSMMSSINSLNPNLISIEKIDIPLL